MSKESYTETGIDHIFGAKIASVSTGERAMKNLLEKLADKYPDECKLIAYNEDDGGVFYHVPWAWISIRPPKRMNYTPEQRAVLAERLKAYRNIGNAGENR